VLSGGNDVEVVVVDSTVVVVVAGAGDFLLFDTNTIKPNKKTPTPTATKINGIFDFCCGGSLDLRCDANVNG
jgi:hypothetical protein